MLLCNREHHSGVQLTSGVSVDYTANLRCTVTSFGLYDYPSRRVRRMFRVLALAVRHKLGRTPVGSLAQRFSHRIWSTSRFLRSHQRTA
jgi:hypothetical protein